MSFEGSDDSMNGGGEQSPEDTLRNLMGRIEREGGVQGSGKFYTFEEIKELVEEALGGDNPQLESITRAGGLRDAVRDVFLERTKKRVDLKKRGLFSPEADDLQQADEADRAKRK